MSNRIIALALGLFFVAGGTSLCAQPYERVVRDTITVGTEAIAVDNREGSITVSSWARDAVAYRARIVSEQVEASVEDTRIDVARTDTTLSMTTNYEDVEGQWRFGPNAFGYVKSEPAVHYTLRVPASAALRIADHESEIDVSGLSGPLRIDTHEGPIRVTNHGGRAEVSSHEGRMELRDVSGNLVVDSHEGTVTITGLRGRLDVQTHEGRAEVRIDALNEIVADTHEGTVLLLLPAAAGFDLSTDLGDDADFQSDVDLSSARRDGGESQGAVRGGGPLVWLTSHEGRITLRSE